MIGPTFALFIRSLREDARTKFTPISRAALVLVILFFITVNQRNFAAQPAPGLTVFYMVMMVNLFGLVLGGITAFCSAITEEKEDDTLGLLRMTNLSPLAILFGKGISRLVSGALLIVAQLPFTILCVALGGVSATTIWKGYEVLLCTLFFLCNLGLLMSVLSRRTGMAVALAVLIGAVIYVGVPMYYSLGFAWGRGGLGAAPGIAQQAAGYVMSNNPLYQLTMLLQGGGRGFFPTSGNPLIFNGVLGTICFLLSWGLFGRFCSGRAESVPSRKNGKTGGKSLRIPRPGSWAIAWKDFWFLIGGRRGLIYRFIGYGVLVFGFAKMMLSSSPYMQSKDIAGMMIWLALFGLGIELQLGAARIFGIERKGLTLSSLVTLPVPLARVVWQKVIGCLASLIPGMCFVVLGLAIVPDYLDDFVEMLSRGGYRTWMFIYMLSHIIAMPLLICWLSLKMRRGAVASGIAIGVIWNVLFGVLLDNLSRYNSSGYFMFNSVVLAVVSVVLIRAIAKALPRVAAVE